MISSFGNSGSRVSSRLDELIAVGLLTTVVFTTLAHGAVEVWSVAVFELILIALLGLWGIKAVLDRRLQIVIPMVALPAAALLLLGMAQSLAVIGQTGERLSLSMDVEATRHAVSAAFFLASALIMSANFLVTPRRLFFLANMLTIFGALLAVFALLPFFWFHTDAISGPFVNRDHFAAYMSMLTPIPVVLVLRFVPGQARLAYGFAAVLMGTAAVVSGSRGGLLGLTAAMVWMTLMNKRSGWASRLRVGPIAVIATAMIAGVFWIGAAPVVEHLADGLSLLVRSGTPDPSRTAIWRGAVNIIRDRPVMGAGLGAFNTIYPTYGDRLGFQEVQHAHNDYLQALAEGGGVAGIIVIGFLVAIFAAVRRALRSRDRFSSGAALAAGGGILAIVVQSFSQNNLQIPAIALTFLILVGSISGMVETEHQQTWR
jgi:O-antigen ligase